MSEIWQAIQKLDRLVFTTREISSLTGTTLSSASQRLAKLEEKRDPVKQVADERAQRVALVDQQLKDAVSALKDFDEQRSEPLKASPFLTLFSSLNGHNAYLAISWWELFLFSHFASPLFFACNSLLDNYWEMLGVIEDGKKFMMN